MSLIDSKEIEILNRLSLGMFGFGAQGSAEALNLRRSGISLRLAVRSGGSSEARAKTAGFQTESFESLASEASYVLMNLADQAQGGVYEKYLKNRPQLKALIFPHGFASHFGMIPAKKNGPLHVLIAPKGAASGLQRLYGEEKALPAILAVKDENGDREPTPEEKEWIEALAKAMGCHPKKLVWARFQDEAVSDLFSEQVLLCGGVTELLRKTFECLVERGYSKDTAYFETLYELKLIVDLIWEEGIDGMRRRISPTARYGDITRGSRVIGDEVKNSMKKVLEEIESGKFAREFLEKESSDEYQKLWDEQAQHPIEESHRRLS